MTAPLTGNHLITPCPVCGMIAKCPHTPVRCQHLWVLIGQSLEPSVQDVLATRRECKWCGRVERPKMIWEAVKP